MRRAEEVKEEEEEESDSSTYKTLLKLAGKLAILSFDQLFPDPLWFVVFILKLTDIVIDDVDISSRREQRYRKIIQIMQSVMID